MNYYCYNNARPNGSSGRGKIERKDRIKVGISDLVMLRGYGVFDFMRTYHGQLFRINDYLERFENSAKGMKLKLPLGRKELIRIIKLLLKKNQAEEKDLGIRLLLTGGYSLDSYLPAVKPNLFVLIEDLPNYPRWWSEKGIKLITHEHSREMAEVKTINYLTAIHLADVRRKYKAQDTLYCYNGKVLETTRNNFFLFHGNTLVTSNESVLHGITRKAVLELAKGKFKVEVRPVLKKELNTCTECFITGTTRGITPVVRIDNIKIADGKPGRHTKELMNAFNILTLL
jgi:branched-chain amino acid aminotransferase